MSMLAGWKTYLVAAAAILTAWAAWATGKLSLPDAFEATITAVLAATIRKGITTEVAKTKGGA